MEDPRVGDETKPDAVVARCGLELRPVGTAYVALAVTPGAATQDTMEATGWTLWISLGALGVVISLIPIPTPLRHVPMHVIQSKSIWSIHAHRGRNWMTISQRWFSKGKLGTPVGEVAASGI